jgi:predicted nucleotidyltransferase
MALAAGTRSASTQAEHRDRLIEEQDELQIEAIVGVAREVFGNGLIGAYLHGSAVLGGLRPTSDVDVLAVIDRPTTQDHRRRLIDGLMPLSGSPVAGTPKRPVELTVVTQSEVKPWRYPPRMEFQYGEWLRTDYQSGFVPEPGPNADVAPLITVVLMGNRALAGPPPAAVLDPVPAADLRRALVSGIPDLMADLEPDTRNVLLTLARIWQTLATGEIHTKDDAAAWASDRLPAPIGDVIARAGRRYVEGVHGDWAGSMAQARVTAGKMIDAINRLT